MRVNLGKVRPGSTLYFPFDAFIATTGVPATVTNFAVGDILIYKDGSTTQRSSTSGFTLLDTDGVDFDGVTGIHGYSVALSDNSDAGFYAAGSRYMVAVSPITVDSTTQSFWHGQFTIGYDGSLFDTTIATLATQTSFTLTAGPAEDDALNGCIVIIHDVASAVQMGYGVVSDYTGATKTVTLVAGATFTAAATDNISILPPALLPTVAGRQLDVSTGGEAGVDWANVGSPTTTVNLSGTTINTTQKVDVETIKTNAVVNGGTVTFPTNATLASTTNITAGTMTTTTTATNVTTVNGLAANVITAASMAADAGAEIADAVWDEAIAGHLTGGTTGAALNAAGSAGDPWSTAVPGAYGAGTAGSRIGRIPDIAAGGAGGLFIAGTNAATTITTALTTTFTGNLTGNVGGSTAAVTAGVTVTTNNDKTGYALTSGERNSIADALLDRTDGVETGLTPRGALRLGASADAGKVSGAATTTVVIRNAIDSKDRITATVDGDGNRTAVTTDVT